MTALLRSPATIDGVTFAQQPSKLLVPLRKTFEILGIPVRFVDERLTVGGRKVNRKGPALPDGTRLVPLDALKGWNVGVAWDDDARRARLEHGDREVYVRLGEKRVTIDKSAQELRAVQGDRIVLRARVSTGREGKRTPDGHFRAGPYKARMHRSRLYHNAPMPYSVQIVGNIFVHGFASVPSRPASHGCIRLPTDGTARFFYEWVQVGTPVRITGRWQG